MKKIILFIASLIALTTICFAAEDVERRMSSPISQIETLEHDCMRGGVGDDPDCRALADLVMHQLLDKADYVLPEKGLPFKWLVTNRNRFPSNAG